jgi:hypothetical protein
MEIIRNRDGWKEYGKCKDKCEQRAESPEISPRLVIA